MSNAEESRIVNFDQLPDSAFVSQPVVLTLWGISSATAWRWVKSGLLPRPHKVGPHTTRWRVGELRACLNRNGEMTARRYMAEERYETIVSVAKPLLASGLTRVEVYKRLKAQHGWSISTSRRAVEHVLGKARQKAQY